MCHLQEYHGMEMNVTTAKFDNFDEFLAWKEQEEQLANASYMLHSAPKYCSGNEVWFFTAIELVAMYPVEKVNKT